MILFSNPSLFFPQTGSQQPDYKWIFLGRSAAIHMQFTCRSNAVYGFTYLLLLYRQARRQKAMIFAAKRPRQQHMAWRSIRRAIGRANSHDRCVSDLLRGFPLLSGMVYLCFPLSTEEPAVRRVDEELLLCDSGSPYLGRIHRDDGHPGSQSKVWVCSVRLLAGGDLDECVLWQVLQWPQRSTCAKANSLEPPHSKQQRRKPCSAPGISSKERSSP